MAREPNKRLEERRGQCIAQALEAERLAVNLPPAVREGYVRLAQAWRQLLKEVERAIAERKADSVE